MKDGAQTLAGDGSDLDPEIRRFIREVGEAMARQPRVTGLPHVQRRRAAEAVRAAWARGGPAMIESAERQLPTRTGHVRLRIHRASSGLSPGLVYLHGGGWTMFSIDTHDRLMREYAGRAGCAVLGVDYALSPEARYPAALHQVVDVVRWLHEHGRELGIETSRLAIGGDSAGANLAISACLSLRDARESCLPRAMLLSYGAYSIECSAAAAMRYGGDAYMLSPEEMSDFWRGYMRGEADAQDPLVCPLLARLEGLPPAFLSIAGCDILAEQNLEMAGRLRAAGVPVEAAVYPGASHSFLEAAAVSRVSDRALTEAASWLRSVLHSG